VNCTKSRTLIGLIDVYHQDQRDIQIRHSKYTSVLPLLNPNGIRIEHSRFLFLIETAIIALLQLVTFYFDCDIFDQLPYIVYYYNNTNFSINFDHFVDCHHVCVRVMTHLCF